MAARMIDRNAHRFGATISFVGIVIAYLAAWRPIAPIMTAVFAVGVLFGLRYSPLGASYRAVKKVFKLNIAVLPEEEPPPRFAQTMGLVFMAIATIGFYTAGWDGAAWVFVVIVAALQALLGVTGICVGCEMYLIGKRLSARTGT